MKKLAFTFNEQSLKVVEYDREIKQAFATEGVERLTHDTYAMLFPDEADYEECAKDVAKFLGRFGLEEDWDYTL